MKIIVKIIAIASVHIFLSCNTAPENKEENKTANTQIEDKDSVEISELNLREYGIEGSIAVPKELSEESKINENAYGGLEIRAGKDYAIELLPALMSIEEKKVELGNNPIYTITYLDEQPDYLFYKKEISDSGVEEEFHFYMLKEFDNGDVYIIKTLDMESFSKPKVEKMLNILRSSKTQV